MKQRMTVARCCCVTTPPTVITGLGMLEVQWRTAVPTYWSTGPSFIASHPDPSTTGWAVLRYVEDGLTAEELKNGAVFRFTGVPATIATAVLKFRGGDVAGYPEPLQVYNIYPVLRLAPAATYPLADLGTPIMWDQSAGLWGAQAIRTTVDITSVLTQITALPGYSPSTSSVELLMEVDTPKQIADPLGIDPIRSATNTISIYPTLEITP